MTDFATENAFYHSATPERMGKLVSQYELFKKIVDIPGAIVECGVYKGASLSRWALFRSLLSSPQSKEIIAFDTFGEYFRADTARDEVLRAQVVKGGSVVSVEAMRGSLEKRRLEERVTLVPGDIRETVPAYVRERPELKISLLNVDVDFYEASVTILKELLPRVTKGGIVILDDYGVFEGETKAVDELMPEARIRKHPFAYSPCWVEA